MAKRRGSITSRPARVSTGSVGPVAAGKAASSQVNGGRAVPGKVPRGSLPRPALTGFTTLSKAILDKLDRGVVLLDVKGKVLDANAIGRAVLANGNGLMVRNDRLAFADGEFDSRFDRLLKANGDARADGKPARKTGEKADPPAAKAARVVAAKIKRPGAVSCRVLVTPVTLDGDTHTAGFLALIYAPAERRDITPEVLLEIYGLTRAQADVARRLYAGLSVEETAARLGLSLNTVRTHLKQIFSKCEVQSQAELMHTLALGPQSF
jgi:DNA-binding CsgD family transcriptional regulator